MRDWAWPPSLCHPFGPHLFARHCLMVVMVVGGALSWSQHQLRGQQLLLSQQPVFCSRLASRVQEQEVTPTHPPTGPRLLQRLPHSAAIVFQQPSVNLGGRGAKWMRASAWENFGRNQRAGN